MYLTTEVEAVDQAMMAKEHNILDKPKLTGFEANEDFNKSSEVFDEKQ